MNYNVMNFSQNKFLNSKQSGELVLAYDDKHISFINFFEFPPFFRFTENRLLLINVEEKYVEDLKGRYAKMGKNDVIVAIAEEIEDGYSDDSLFNISSWGADLSFRELIAMYEEEELVKPELQRKYVWDKLEASRFIESILMGLPVPSIFLAQSGSQKLIVDGYQRIMTVHDYIHGIFGADNKPFRLSNSEKINVRWRNKSFAELTNDEQRKIRSTTIHAIIFEQKKPENGDTSLYQIFERINTSGRTLNSQEIRNCVYQGTFNKLLFELNENPTWRTLFGSRSADNRMRDIECILRFFVMKSDSVQNTTLNKISLKKNLNDFMGKHKNATEDIINQMRLDFLNVIEKIYSELGVNAFRSFSNKGKFTKKFHPAIFDAISVAVYLEMQTKRNFIINKERHIDLLIDDSFKNATTERTTDTENIRKRIALAKDYLIEEI